jgi:DNA polymerase-3 subunit beta
MRIQFQPSELRVAVARLQSTVSDRSLSAIGLKAQDGTLQLTASDRVLSVYTSIPCSVQEAGSVFVQGRLFLDIIRELPEHQTRIHLESTNLVIESLSNSHFLMRIPLINDQIWREAPEFLSANSCRIPSDRLAYMIHQVDFCISQDSPRAFGTVGMMHRTGENKIRLVGTDGFRLSYCDIEVQTDKNFLNEPVCLSKRALSELYSISQSGAPEIDLRIDSESNTMYASIDNHQVFIRLSAVKFPNYEGVLPSANLNLVKLSRPVIQTAMKRVLLAADKSRALQLSFSNSSLTLSSKTLGSSEGSESIALEGYKGVQRDLFVNGKFLSDVFSATNSETLMLQFKAPEDPIVVVPNDELNKCKSLHVLVPIRESR